MSRRIFAEIVGRSMRAFCTEGHLRPFESIPSATPTDLSNVPRALVDNPGANIHRINQLRHGILGPMYRESLGPDVSILWVADADLCQDVFRQEGQQPVHLIPEAWLVQGRRSGRKRGLFFLDGDEWVRWRRAMNPVFVKGDLTNCFDWIGQATEELLHSWQRLANIDSGSVEIPDLEFSLHGWSVNAVMAALFGARRAKMDIDLPVFIKSVKTILEMSVPLQFLSAEKEAEGNTDLWVKFSDAVDHALGTMHEAALANSKHCDATSLVGQIRLSTDFTEEEIGRMAADLIIAAADTTSITAAWVMHKLAFDSQEQAAARCDEKRIKWHIKECLRMYPVAPFLTRIMDREIQLGGVTVPAGQLILMSIYSMGRMEKYFVHPETYWPGRWERRGGRLLGVNSGFASLPFGHGARNCIGRKIAEQGISALVTGALSNFELFDLNCPDSVDMTMRFTGRPDKLLRVGIQKRP